MCGKESDISMATTIRPELSEQSKYWISKHRYYELKHFCLQYPLWKKAYTVLDGWGERSNDITICSSANQFSDPTYKCAEAREFYANRMKMITDVANATDPALASYIVKGVTEGVSYSYLKSRLDIPCCKGTYYDQYRRFFWLLSEERR